MNKTVLTNEELQSLENFAYNLAKEAGNKIIEAITDPGKLTYKNAKNSSKIPNNPVTDADKNIEAFIRASIQKEYPEHTIIGEEEKPLAISNHALAWVIDPIDGTTNFVNQLPIFGCSIGLMFNNSPIIGAIWISVSHQLTPGVYHANLYSKIKFNNQSVDINKAKQGIKRGLHTLPYAIPTKHTGSDVRVSGCAVFEITMLAIGILDGAYLNGMRLWDIAAGIVLLRAGKKEVWIKNKHQWNEIGNSIDEPLPLPKKIDEIQNWHGTIVAGEEKDIDILKNRFNEKNIIFGLLLRLINSTKYLLIAKLKAMANNAMGKS